MNKEGVIKILSAYTQLYNNNDTVEILFGYAKKKLEEFAQNMPKGQCWNLHNGGSVCRVDAIGIQADNTVVALFKTGCSVNPLILDKINKKPWGGFRRVELSTRSCGGTFVPDYAGTSNIDWEASVERYNKGLYNKNKIIVGIYVFGEEEMT